LSIDGADRLLDGWQVQHHQAALAPVRAAAGILEQFGARVEETRRTERDCLRLGPRPQAAIQTRLAGWRGEEAVAGARANGAAFTAFVALRLAGAATLAGRRRADCTLQRRALAAEIASAISLSGGSRPELVRCLDGWTVARWRDESERELFRALVGDPCDQTRAHVVAHGRLARLLVAPVEPVPRSAPAVELGDGDLHGAPCRSRCRPRVIDWTMLWAGPWAADQLRRSGSVVQRVEHPRRRDGLFGWPEGRRLWRGLNGHKRLRLLDARSPCDREQLERVIKRGEILITSMTPRALRSLQFDDGWRVANAPHLLHVELVAFEPPWEDSPGLGEHAAAQAGMLWRADDSPARPAPWADPLLGAAALAVAQAWLSSTERPGGRVRLSLERAASLAFAVPGAFAVGAAASPPTVQSGIE